MAFVLTGKDDWMQWSRDALYKAIVETGHSHSEKIRGPQDTLVSSRDDTIKAVQAAAKGASVITYSELHSFLNGGGRLSTGGYVVPPPTPIDMTPMETLDGWGSF